MGQKPKRNYTNEQFIDQISELSENEIRAIVESLPTNALEGLLEMMNTGALNTQQIPPTPDAQAKQIDPGYQNRAHLQYLGTRLAKAIADVENGQSRYMVVNMPPRTGKSTLVAEQFPLWVLRKHPDWDVVMVSHDPNLAISWARQVRRMIEDNVGIGVTLSPDVKAAGEWETTEGGGVLARSIRGSLTGRGAKVLIVDDPVKDMIESLSVTTRNSVWDWWLTVAQTRLEHPVLVVVVMTRWHEDDMAGRILSQEYDGDPNEWEVIQFPALAETGDVLGRKPGDPLFTPLLKENREEAIERWEKTKRSVGTYTFSALYQQKPAPSKGTVFDVGWWRFWTNNPAKATEDGRVRYVDFDNGPEANKTRWLDSWDCTFKSTDDSDYVVGQRWAQHGPDRFLISQVRRRMSFTATISEMELWHNGAKADNRVHERLVEDKANGTAVIDVLRRKIPGLIPINPTESKLARARAITPEIEAGNVYLPHPGDPGNEWVRDFLDEVRSFPRGSYDDQVDAMTQALYRLRSSGFGQGGVAVAGAGPTGRRIQRKPGQTTNRSGINRRLV